MSETSWYRIVGRKRVARQDVLPARSGRFHEDPIHHPTSYLGNSLMTVWMEAQSARAGAARLNLEAFAGWRVVLREATFVDFRKPGGREKWSLNEAELLGDPAPPKCKEVARTLRSAAEGIQGILYRSVRHPPDGVCLALFLEREDIITRFERVTDKEWKAFMDALPQEKE